jgi:predicted Zn-dependent peptidase
MVFFRLLNSILLSASVLSLVFGGCGSSAPALVARPPPSASAVERLPAGATVAVTRPTPGLVRLSLWLDVGTRDAAVPQLATLAAWWAAERSGLEARTLPDAIELAMTCALRVDSLETCVERLARAFTFGALSEADAAKLRGRLREARLRALSIDERIIERQALEALFGANGRALAPFGDEDGDVQLSAKNIAAFARQHMHAGRAVLVGVGDVTGQALDQAWRSFSPRREIATKTQRDALPAASGLVVEEGPLGKFAFALSAPGNAQAAAMARDFMRIYEFGQAHVVRLRGHNVLLVTMPAGAEPWKRLQRATFDLRRLAAEAKPRTAPPRGESLIELSAEIGEEWAARGEPSLEFPAPWPLGVAVHMREAAHALPTEKASAAKREQWLKLAKGAIERGEELARGESDGSISSLRADVKTDNGVRIRVERRPGARFMSAFVRFAGGSRDDASEQGGQAALLATALTNGCGFSEGAALDARLLFFDAHLTPMVSPSAFGARIHAPSARTEEVVDTLLRCALRPALDARSIEDARLRLVSTLQATEASLYEAFAARSLDADAPGAYASWGTPRGVSAVSASELRRAHDAALVGQRIDVVIIADADPRVLARFVARRVAHLARGEAAQPQGARTSKPTLIGERTRVRSPRAIVSLRSEGEKSSKVASSAVAQALGEAIAARVGRLVWVGAGAAKNAGWAAAAIEIGEEELTSFAAQLRVVLGELKKKPEAFWRQRLTHEGREKIASLSTAQGVTELMFHDALHTPDDATLLTQVRDMLNAQEGVAILRPGR